MAITFIHTADWQIGKQFGQISGDIAAFLRESRFKGNKKDSPAGQSSSGRRYTCGRRRV